MPSLNVVILAGNLTRDPELRTFQSGSSVCQFSLAINRRYNVQGEWREETTFVDCDCFGKSGENVNEYLRKGDPLLVKGRLQLDSWQDRRSGQTKSKLKVRVEEFTFIGSTEDTGAGDYQEPPQQQRRQYRQPPARGRAPARSAPARGPAPRSRYSRAPQQQELPPDGYDDQQPPEGETEGAPPPEEDDVPF